MIADVLNCKNQKVDVVPLLNLFLEKDIILEVGSIKTAKEWMFENVHELLDPEGKEVSKFRWPFFGFLDRWIVLTEYSKFIGIVDKDGLEELKKEASVKMYPYMEINLTELLKFTSCGFVEAGEAKMKYNTFIMELQDKIAKCLKEHTEFTGRDTDYIKFTDFKALFLKDYMSLKGNEEHREFCNNFYRIVDSLYNKQAEAVVLNDAKCILNVKWINTANKDSTAMDDFIESEIVFNVNEDTDNNKLLEAFKDKYAKDVNIGYYDFYVEFTETLKRSGKKVVFSPYGEDKDTVYVIMRLDENGDKRYSYRGLKVKE